MDTNPLLGLGFQFEFRKYQRLILARIDQQLQKGDDKFHIVAPPGSGKTIIRIELIRKLDRGHPRTKVPDFASSVEKLRVVPDAFILAVSFEAFCKPEVNSGQTQWYSHLLQPSSSSGRKKLE